MRPGKAPRGLALLVRPDREEASLWRRFAATQEGRLRESLFGRYQRFARSLARRHARRRDFAEETGRDLEQFAYHGLLEAIDRFDPQRGVSFLSFAAARIAGSIVDGLGRLDEHGAQLRFRQRIERERIASLEVGGEDARSAIEELANLATELALGLMLDAEERESSSGLAGQPYNGFDSLAWRETRALLAERVDDLPEPERTVIRQHYQNDLLFAQIAVMLGVSKGRVSQLHKAALARLRKSMRTLR